METVQQIAAGLAEQFGELTCSEFRGQIRVAVPRDLLFEVAATLRDPYGFDMLVDITCVDYLNYRDARDRLDRKSTRLNSSHSQQSRMPSSA